MFKFFRKKEEEVVTKQPSLSHPLISKKYREYVLCGVLNIQEDPYIFHDFLTNSAEGKWFTRFMLGKDYREIAFSDSSLLDQGYSVIDIGEGLSVEKKRGKRDISYTLISPEGTIRLTPGLGHVFFAIAKANRREEEGARRNSFFNLLPPEKGM